MEVLGPYTVVCGIWGQIQSYLGENTVEFWGNIVGFPPRKYVGVLGKYCGILVKYSVILSKNSCIFVKYIGI